MVQIGRFVLAIVFVWALVLGSTVCAQVAPVRQQIVDIARSQIGVREVGNNAGPRVEHYQRLVGIRKGDAWCMAFTYFCFDSAGVYVVKSGWVPSWFPKAKLVVRQGYEIQQPLPGDVGGLYYRRLGRYAHGFIIEKWGNVVLTIEGNTNAQGARDGNGVWRRRRLKSQIPVVSRWV